MAEKKKKTAQPIEEKLAPLREEINNIDEQILEALARRAEYVLKVAEVKKNNRGAYYAPHREKQIYARLSKMNKGKFPDEAVHAIFREIMSASIAMEKPQKIAYLGPEASYTHMASLHKFGSQMEFVAMDSIEAVFTEVGKGWADYGVVPIENSTEGVISNTLDMFIDSEMKICSEIVMPISHNLISLESDFKKIKKVYSRDSALAQCHQWLANNLPNAELVAVSSTTRGVQMAKRSNKSAAISSELASSLYKVPIQARGIEDMTGNRTRFLVISLKESERSGDDKTSLLFSIKDKVGALYNALRPFYKLGINMTRIESRPSRRKAWDYVFFVDILGYKDDPKLAKALSEVSEHCAFLKVLGSYPISTE